MLLANPDEIATLISMTPAGGAGNANIDNLKALINNARFPIEAAMNVDTLSRKTGQDMFKVKTDGANSIVFRLTNGFVVADTVTVQGPDGSELPEDSFIVNLKLGVIILDSGQTGTYRISYTSGFEYDDQTLIVKDAPEELTGIVASQTLLQLRTAVLSPRLPTIKSLIFEQVAPPLYRDISRRIIGWYQRPRIGVEWPQHYQEI